MSRRRPSSRARLVPLALVGALAAVTACSSSGSSGSGATTRAPSTTAAASIGATSSTVARQPLTSIAGDTTGACATVQPRELQAVLQPTVTATVSPTGCTWRASDGGTVTMTVTQPAGGAAAFVLGVLRKDPGAKVSTLGEGAAYQATATGATLLLALGPDLLTMSVDGVTPVPSQEQLVPIGVLVASRQ